MRAVSSLPLPPGQPSTWSPFPPEGTLLFQVHEAGAHASCPSPCVPWLAHLAPFLGVLWQAPRGYIAPTCRVPTASPVMIVTTPCLPNIQGQAQIPKCPPHLPIWLTLHLEDPSSLPESGEASARKSTFSKAEKTTLHPLLSCMVSHKPALLSSCQPSSTLSSQGQDRTLAWAAPHSGLQLGGALRMFYSSESPPHSAWKWM